MASPVWRRDALVSLSLANILALHLWASVLDPATAYLLEEARPWTAYAATVVLVLALGASGFVFGLVARRSEGRTRRVLEALLFFAVAAAVWEGRAEVADLLGSAKETLDAPAGIALVAVVTLAFLPARPRAKARRTIAIGLLILSPFAAVTTFQGVYAALRARPDALAPRTPAARSPGGTGTRVVVVVMDELDQFRLFEDRRTGISLPTFDALDAEGYHATRARFPSNKTEKAIPSLLTGKRVVDAEDAGTSDRWLVYESGQRELFSEAETFLSEARAAGRNVALAGWYHPYCRVLGDDLVDCLARSNRRETQGLSFGTALLRQSGILAQSLPHGTKLARALGIAPRRLTKITPQWHLESFRILHAKGLALAADPALDLVFLHYPVPHAPAIYDAGSAAFIVPPLVGPSASRRAPHSSLGAASLLERGGSYDDNLALADRALGELLVAMRESGVADRTALVVLADHPKRTKRYAPTPSPRLKPGELRPIPFFVRLPDASPLRDEESRFSSERLRTLVPALLDGRVTDSKGVRALLRGDWVAGP